jgi:dihydroorotase
MTDNISQSMLITGGRVIDPAQKLDRKMDLLLQNGQVLWLGEEGKSPALSEAPAVLSARGKVVCPGFIDLHCHLREPGFEEKETIATGTRAGARGGFTTLCCMPNTNPPVDSRAVVDYVVQKARSEGVVRVLPIGCISQGRHGEGLAEMGELAEAGVMGYSDDGAPVSSARLMRHALEYSRAWKLPVISHPEELSLTDGGQMNEGAVATRLGLKGMPAEAEQVMVARDIALARLTGGRLHLAHISSAGSVELVRRAKEEGTSVTAEVTPHHLTLTEERVMGYDTNAKVNPPLRTREDIAAFLQGLGDGVIDAIATDHAPHAAVDKMCEFGLAAFGISGLETALGSLLTLVNQGELELGLVIARLTSGPAAVLGDKHSALGTLKIGFPADVTIFDPKGEWLVSEASLISKGKNTPLLGTRLKGKIVATIYGGRIVYKEGISNPP